MKLTAYEINAIQHKQRITQNKGVREYNLIINYFLTLDYVRGATLGQLSKRYKLDKNNLQKRIKGVLNKKYYEKLKKIKDHQRAIEKHYAAINNLKG